MLFRSINSLGEIIMTTDVVIKKDSKGLVTTSHGISYHTDHHKARFIAWYCYKQTDNGGESLLIDAEKIYFTLPKDLQEDLKSVYLFEHQIYDGDRKSYPFVTIDQDSNLQFHCSLVDDKDKDNPAFTAFEELMNATEPITIKLQGNDVLIIDNHRMFHGRTPIKGSQDRFLKRFWIKGFTVNS